MGNITTNSHFTERGISRQTKKNTRQSVESMDTPERVQSWNVYHGEGVIFYLNLMQLQVKYKRDRINRCKSTQQYSFPIFCKLWHPIAEHKYDQPSQLL